MHDKNKLTSRLTLSLSLNGRTAVQKFRKTIGPIIDELRNITDRPIVGFQCYSDRQTKFIKKTIKEFIETKYQCREIDFPSFGDLKKQKGIDNSRDYYQELITIVRNELKTTETPMQKKFLLLYEPIDFNYKILDSGDKQKTNFHTLLTRFIKERGCKMLIFGNIPYEIFQFGARSPLIEFIYKIFTINEFSINQVQGFDVLEKHIKKYIYEKTKGHFEILPTIESFCENININKRLIQLIDRFIDIPVNTQQNIQVKKQLKALSQFISNNKERLPSITFDEEKGEIRFPQQSKLLKAYFEKTSLFECKMSDNQYIITPKSTFRKCIENVGFIGNQGEIKPLAIPNEETKTKDEASISEIVSYFRTSKPVFIMGAGTSIESGAPDNIKLMNSILCKLHSIRGIEYKEIKDVNELIGTFRKWVNMEDINTLRRYLLPKLEGLKPSIGHFYLAQFLFDKRINIVLTTNFDTLIEDALMDFGIRSNQLIKLIGSENTDWKWLNKINRHRLKIFKLCGDLFYGDHPALSDEKAKKWIRNASPQLKKIMERHDSKRIIIIGHTLSEPSFPDLLANYREFIDDDVRAAFVNPDPSACQRFKNIYAGDFNDIITISGELAYFSNFMEKLYEKLK
jgi:uncharacterized protein YdhG (YjbR/CyaY superfamily)